MNQKQVHKIRPETRTFPVKMLDQVRFKFKMMSGQADMTLGQLLEEMLDSLQARLDRYRRDFDIVEGFEAKAVLELIFDLDQGVISPEKFSQEMKKLRKPKA